MNKIKLLYDVVRTMKAKEKVEGILTAQVQKEGEELFSLRNEFGKNSAGDGSAKVACELNLEGGRVKRESLTEFSATGNCREQGGLFGKLSRHHHARHESCGIKGVLSKIALALGILNSLKAEERDNGGAVVSLNLSEAPEEIRSMLLEKINRKHAGHPQCGLLAESDALETLDGVVLLTVNEGREIERITVNLDARVLNAAGEPRNLAANAEVQFSW